jgi:hypothetical protein
MLWANLLHFYQPYGQKRNIIDAIVAQCYRPVVQSLLDNRGAKVTINFSGVLLDLLAEYGYRDIIDMYAEAARLGRVEFVGSAKYHAILPLLPEAEVRRQVEINNATNRKYFGSQYAPRGIFLPEMAWSPELAPVLDDLGFEWVMLDELAAYGRIGKVNYSQTYEIKGTKLRAIFREHRLSSMLSWVARDIEQLKQAARAGGGLSGRYILTGMDGEVFGHHQIGHDELLAAMFKDAEITMITASEIIERFPKTTSVATVSCTWASSGDDISKGIQFISWNDPHNEIHALQWQLLHLTIKQLGGLTKTHADYRRLRERLDWAIGSDQFYWAAGRPWWMIEYIERGAYDLLSILKDIPGSDPSVTERAQNLYHEILSLAYEWQRSGKIDSKDERPRVPFKELTLEQGDQGMWHGFIDMMRDEEKKAARRGDYEAAILWRNGVYKLEHKLDIFDSLYIIDLLRRTIPRGEVDAKLKYYKKKFDRIRGGQVEQRSN